MVVDLNPGPAPGAYFPANDGTTGYELWAIESGEAPTSVPALPALAGVCLALTLGALGVARIQVVARS